MMDENILRFPGFVVSADRKHVYWAGNKYQHTPAMARDMTEQERWRTLDWYKRTHNPKGADYRKMYLSMTDEQLGRSGGSAA
jgi:hypothetical protein